MKLLMQIIYRFQTCFGRAHRGVEFLEGRLFGLLWDDLLVRLLLRVTDPPTPKEVERRARIATESLLT
jgi:hypothetical protein